MPDPVGPQPVESHEQYQKAVADYKEAQQRGSNLPTVVYDQPGQVLTPEQLPDPRVNILAGFAPQELSSVAVLPKAEALAHPSGPELGDALRSDAEPAKLVADFAAKHGEKYDEEQRLAGLSEPERAQERFGHKSGTTTTTDSSASRPSKS